MLTASGLASLLARLDPEVDRAALEYERLRRTLVAFFEWRGAGLPDACADEALDRLARRLAEDLTVKDVRSYAHGIARLVLFEQRRQPLLVPIDETVERSRVAVQAEPSVERMGDCLDRCLAEMPSDSRSLVLRYYQGDGGVRIASRRKIAEALGLSDGALRSRVQRLRDRLQACLEACRKEPS